jgi:hypothetical protein
VEKKTGGMLLNGKVLHWDCFGWDNLAAENLDSWTVGLDSGKLDGVIARQWDWDFSWVAGLLKSGTSMFCDN